jgi:hypothetical protein
VVEKALLISLVSKVEGVLSTEVSSFDKEANILDADISQENKIISDYRAAAHCGPQQLYKHKPVLRRRRLWTSCIVLITGTL